MHSHDELKSVHGFLRTTGEGHLKNMLLGGRMTETHFRALIKVIRSASEDEFLAHFEAGSFPKIKFNPAEIAAKETLWSVWTEAFVKVGLLTAVATKVEKKAA